MILKKHNERCKGCKKAVEELLSSIFGEVKVNYNLNLPSSANSYKDSTIYSSLIKIHSALVNYRGNDDFVKVKKLPNVDFFVPNPSLIVEFDESQHFTKPRYITLDNYTDTLSLGFDKAKWKTICNKLDRIDNNPIYRDEQRAWYDTLRDFAPSFLGLIPTKRLFASDYVWCSLNSESKADIETFKDILDRHF